jgi:hypothetical protein
LRFSATTALRRLALAARFSAMFVAMMLSPNQLQHLTS